MVKNVKNNNKKKYMAIYKKNIIIIYIFLNSNILNLIKKIKKIL